MTYPPPREFPTFTFTAHAAAAVPADNSSEPLRPKASPRSTPSHSGQSTPSGETVASEAPSSGHESPTRGRRLSVLIPRSGVSFANPPSQAGPGSVDMSLDHVSRRLISKDFIDSPEKIDPSDAEPFPTLEFGSNASGILSAATVRDSADWSSFLGHRDTFALRDMRRCVTLSKELPESFFRRLLRYIDFDTYLSVRLSCRCWSWAITCARPLMFITSPPKRPLPKAVLQQIYDHLSPVDFNAARHARWAWMDASLDYRLLTRMLERGSWGNAARTDFALYEECGAGRFADDEWLLSKRLATECSLRPDWTGNGLDHAIQDASTSHLNHCSKPLDGRSAFESFTLVSQIDFSMLNANQNNPDDIHPASTLQFTSSVCGKYLLVTRHCIIYLYFLNHGASATYYPRSPNPVEALTHIVCPYRVLAVSMDTSSHRFAVAALLEGRVGLICDLNVLGAALRRPNKDAHPLYSVSSACWEYQVSVANSGQSDGMNDHPLPSFPAPSPRDGLRRTTSSEYSTDPKCPSHSQSLPSPLVAPEIASFEPGPLTLYYDICSAIDPPLSVAICAQRQCVAFGCSTAIELHWVDALTSQRLKRGFSISAVVDILYFFPVREDEKRLRVVGSSVVPTACGAVLAHGGESEFKSGNGEVLQRDYQRYSGTNYFCNAIPLSDGSHVLFTNSSTGDICLGKEDVPTPTGIDTTCMKLETIVIFEAPLLTADIVGKRLDRLYEAARDLNWGARVVIGFGDEIWVFAVPGDWLRGSKTGKGDVPDEKERPIARVGGIRVGMVEGLERVGICADGGGVLVWGVGAVGVMREWRLGASGREKRWVAKCFTDENGILGNDPESKTIGANASRNDGDVMYDADGDVIMSGTEGHNPPSVHHRSESRPQDTLCHDADGDVMMSDAIMDLALETDALNLDQGPGPVPGPGIKDPDEGYASEDDSDGRYGDGDSDGAGYEGEDLDEGYFSDDDESAFDFHPGFLEGSFGGRGRGRGGRWVRGSADGSEDVWESSGLEVQVLGCSG